MIANVWFCVFAACLFGLVYFIGTAQVPQAFFMFVASLISGWTFTKTGRRP